MKFSISSRDFKFFLSGLIAAFILVTIYNLSDNFKDMKEGAAQGKLDYEQSTDGS